jgi:hypothetical protein
MMIIATILVTMFIFLYVASRPNATGAAKPSRTLLYSVVASILIFGQIYLTTRQPPVVDYWATGWGPFITYLNQLLAWRGSPHRIPAPGN